MLHAPGPRRWLILADDLTGAGDCAVSFRRTGLDAVVRWGEGGEAAGPERKDAAPEETPSDHSAHSIPPSRDSGEDTVLAVNVDSRARSAAEAAAAHRVVLERAFRPGQGLIKKIDSTLRGQPVAELVATLEALRVQGGPAMAILAPAFPATGRITRGGRVLLNGAPLEETPLWARDHTYGTADLIAVLEEAGLHARLLSAGTQPLGGETIAEALAAALRDGVTVLVCDAECEEDLASLARVSLPMAEKVFWVGSGGIAAALAAATRGEAGTGGPSDVAVRSAGAAYAVSRRPGVLLVVGSVAEASRASSAALAATGRVKVVVVDAVVLDAGPGDARWKELSREIAAAIGVGQDVLVEIAADPAADLRRGATLAAGLAALLRPAAAGLGGIFVTGGETACALLGALGVHGIRMLDEIEPGVPLGISEGALRVPVVTKAGAFGDRLTLARCLDGLNNYLGAGNEGS